MISHQFIKLIRQRHFQTGLNNSIQKIKKKTGLNHQKKS